MPCTLYKYSGKSIYTMYLDLKCFKSHLTYEKEYIDDNIEEMSLYELDHVAFMYPLFSGKYFVDYSKQLSDNNQYCSSRVTHKNARIPNRILRLSTFQFQHSLAR